MSEETKQPRDDSANWAKSVERLQVGSVPAGVGAQSVEERVAISQSPIPYNL